MANKTQIEKRRNELEKFILEQGCGKVLYKDINKFYKNFKDPETNNLIYANLSEDTQRKDLKSIGATCKKKDGNTYTLPCYENLVILHQSISNILSTCTVYKPFLKSVYLNKLKIFNNSKNPNAHIFTVMIVSNKKNKNTILELQNEIEKLYAIYDGNILMNELYIEVFNYHIEYTFLNIKNVKKFYDNIVKLQNYKNDDFIFVSSI